MEKFATIFVSALFVCGIYALFSWGVSVLVSYIFDVDFGFWKAAALLVLCSLIGGFFGKRNGGGAA